MPHRPLSWILLALVAFPLAGRADEEEAPAPAPAPPPAAGGPMLHGRLELGLADAIRMGLENNLDVQVERYSPMIAGFDEEGAWGAYDPTAFAELGYSDTQTPTANVFLGPENVVRRTDGFGGLRGLVPWLSTEYKAQFDGATEKDNSSIQALFPELTSGWSLSVTQPLLKDLIWNQPWTQVQTTRLLHESSREEFRRAVMDVVQEIEDAYWGLVATEEGLRVAQKSLDTAQALLEQTRAQFEVGVVSKVEVTEAEAGLAQREVDVIRAKNQYRNQQDVVIDRVLGPNLRASSTLMILPTDRPEEFTPFEVDVEAAVARAFEHRPELATALKEIERQTVQLKFANNQVFPELNGVLNYGQKGLAGSGTAGNPALGVPPIPDQGDWGSTFDDYSDSPQFSARAIFSIPFPNRTARSRKSTTELELARARTQQRRLEQQIIIEVRQAARNLLASQEGIDAADSAQRAAEEQLRAEEIRLEYGESTPFDVLQREEQLADAERTQIEAYQAYRTSVTALDRAQGTILRNRNIKIAEVAPLR